MSNGVFRAPVPEEVVCPMCGRKTKLVQELIQGCLRYVHDFRPGDFDGEVFVRRACWSAVPNMATGVADPVKPHDMEIGNNSGWYTAPGWTRGDRMGTLFNPYSNESR